MALNKIIKQVDINCNIAFLDICDDTKSIYLLCCSGQQYPNYPCYGSPDSGFSPLSSICRAALCSGLSCGEQFFVFYAGETSDFQAITRNGVKTLPCSEYSKSYQIKDVRSVLAEHKKLKSSVDEYKRASKISSNRIRELEFSIEGQKCENRTLVTRLGEYEKQLVNAKKETEKVKRECENLKQERVSSKRLKSIEIETSNIEKKKLEEAIAKKEQTNQALEKEIQILKKQTEDLNKKINAQEKENQNKKIEKKEKKKQLEELKKEINAHEASLALHECMNELEKISTQYQENIKKKNEDKTKGNAINDMKQILSVLEVLKVKVEDENASQLKNLIVESFGVGQKTNGNDLSVENTLNKTEELIKTLFVDCDKKASEDFNKKFADFKTIVKTKNEQESLRPLIHEAKRVIIEKLLTPAETLKKIEKTEIEEALKSYETKKKKMESLQSRLAKEKTEKNLSNAIKTTAEIEQIIKNEILNLNEQIRLNINKICDKTLSLNTVKQITVETKQIDAQIKEAEKDLVEIEKLSPITTEEEKTAKSELTEVEKRIKKDREALTETVEQLKLVVDQFLTKCRVLQNNKLKRLELNNIVESIQFKILRWNEVKDQRKEYLQDHIKERLEAKDFFQTIERLMALGIGCLSNIEQKRLYALKVTGKTLRDEFRDTHMILYNLISTDYENKKKQLARLGTLKTSLNEQIEEAAELMDVDTVNALKEQLENLPKKEKVLLEKIATSETELEKMRENPLFDKSAKLGESKSTPKQTENGESSSQKTNSEAASHKRKKRFVLVFKKNEHCASNIRTRIQRLYKFVGAFIPPDLGIHTVKNNIHGLVFELRQKVVYMEIKYIILYVIAIFNVSTNVI